MKSIKTANRKKTLVLQQGFEFKLDQFEQIVSKHFNDAYQIACDKKYLDSLDKCTFSGKVR